jgi:hypothetical protein
MDDQLLQAARDAGARLLEAERDVERAKADYHHAVRRIHLAGASLREIADALGLSHQRVHQIVEAAGGARGWRVRRTVPEACSFCGRARQEVAHCIAGPGVWICDQCVAEFRGLLTLASASSGASAGSKFGPRCSFCGRKEHRAGPFVEGNGTRICARCLALCEDILRDEAAASGHA